MKPPNLGSRQPEFAALLDQLRRMDPDPPLVAGRIAMAHGNYKRALAIFHGVRNPTAKTAIMLANTLSLAGKPREAIAYLERAERQFPINPAKRGHFLLGLGDYPAAYRLIRSRQIAPNRHIGPRAFTADDVAGRDVVLEAEQGLGDTLMAARFIPHLAQRAAGVASFVQPPLVNLLEGLRPTGPLYVGLPTGRVWSSFFDLFEILGVTPSSIPSVPYLDVPAALIAARRLPRTSKFRVGLCWGGMCRPEHLGTDLRRSIPPEFMLPLMDVADVDFVSLMHPAHHRRGPLPIECVIRPDFDMRATAAIVAQLDLVISVDSALAHLAGALGKPTWMLNRTAGCWRWGWDGAETTPWYQSMRVFTQDRPYDWVPVVEQVRRDLADII